MDQPVRFDDVLIDPAARRVTRGGVEQPLEPKAFGVLVLLAAAPGRAFTRDEILDAVWGHRHVTPGVLNRVMTLLRHALGEDAATPRYLHTLHGVGYRFDLPPAATLHGPAADPPASVEPVAAGDDAAAAPRDATPQRRATDLDAVSTPSRRAWWLAAAAVALVAIGALSWRRDVAAPVPVAARAVHAAPPSLVVLPLKAIGTTAGSRVLADGMSEELIGTLAQIEGLRVIARESTAIAAADSTDPTALAKRLGITHALQGSLQQAGQHLRIRLRLIDARDGSALWAKDFDRDASEVLALQREIAQAVAASLTLKLGLGTASRKSGDAEFLRRLMAARALARNGEITPDKSVEPAEAELRALLRERPDDARVHAELAMALETRAFRRPELAAALREESLQEATLALRLDPSLPEPHYLLAGEACRHDRWEACLAGLTRMRALAPSRLDGYMSAAWVLSKLGYLDLAEAQYRAAAALDPINTGVDFALGRILDTQGRHEDAAPFLARTGPRGVYARWFNAVFRRDYADALRAAEAYDAPNASDRYGAQLKPSSVLTSQALADPALWPQAVASMRQFERDNPGRMSFGMVFAPGAAANAPALIAGLADARRRNYSSYDLLLWTRDLAFLRRDPAFQAYLKDSGILAYWRKHGFPKQCRPQGDGAACD